MVPGDRVIALASKQGTWRTAGVFEETAWYRVSPELPASVAGTMSINPPSALSMLREFVDLSPGDAFVQNGANSAVGRYAIQIAKHRGLRSINVVRERPEPAMSKLRCELEALGADLVTTPKELRAALPVSGLPAPRLALDCVGGDAATAVAKVLAPHGTMVTYGAMSKTGLSIPPSLLIFKDISFRGFWLSGHYAARPRDKEALIDEISDLFLQGVIKPAPVQSIDIADYKRAIDAYNAPGEKVLFTFGN